MTSPEVADAVRRVLADFGVPTAVGLVAEGDLVRAQGDGFAVAIPVGDLTGVDLLAHVADQLQNDAHVWLPGGWGRPAPRCPGHGHPANTRVRDGEVWWVCPATGEPVAPVGALA
jgi:hypothetical protein